MEPNLRHLHPFGCPAYVLTVSTPLQSGAPQPKWSERSKVGIYLCHSPRHASSVALVLNTQTGPVSPQFHVVYDDNFDTVARDAKFESLWQYKAKLLEEEEVEASKLTEPPYHTGGISDPIRVSQLNRYSEVSLPKNLQEPWNQITAASEPQARKVTDQSSATPESSTAQGLPRNPSTARAGTTESEGAHNQMQPTQAHTSPSQHDPASSSQPGVGPSDEISTRTRTERLVRPPNRLIDVMTAVQETVSPRMALAATHLQIFALDDDDLLLEDPNPMALLSAFVATRRSDPDTLTLEQALQEPDADKFIEAMEKEIEDHTTRGHWKVVPISSVPQGNRPIMAVWSMKRKRDPAVEIIKWKARLGAHGGMQTKGVNYWETYSPVVSWSTVRLILILSLVLNWHARSLDFVLAYPQADVKTDIVMRMPKGCHIPAPNQASTCSSFSKTSTASKTPD